MAYNHTDDEKTACGGNVPELIFKGKEFVYNHHLAVPHRPLVPDAGKSIGEPRLDGNLIIHGDNLHALKSLLPMYAGKVDCIFIDPPYNTGNEGWCYNDNVNSPMMQQWLQENPVGIEDGLRHDKWCAMMWPRLRLLHELLAEDAFIAVCVDENEVESLISLLDGVFGRSNRRVIASRMQKKESSNDGKGFSNKADYVVCYSKNPESLVARIPLSDEYVDNSYRDPNRQYPLGKWRPVPIRTTRGHQGGGYEYSVRTPSGRVVDGPWLCPELTYRNYERMGRLYFGVDGSAIPERVIYSHESEGTPPSNLWLDNVTNKIGKNEITNILGEGAFDTPKPVSLVSLVLDILAKKTDSIVLDSFAGSGTTAHAVLAANKKDGGDRRFILVECEDYADRVTAERVRRVISGYRFAGTQREELLKQSLTFSDLKKADKLLDQIASIENLAGHRFDRIEKKVRDGELIVEGIKNITEQTEGLGGEFTYCTLGEPIEMDRMLTGENLPSFQQLGALLFHMATSEVIDAAKVTETDGHGYLGESAVFHVWLIYKPDLDFLKSRDAALTLAKARALAESKPGKRHLVFAPAKFVSQKLLDEEKIPVEFAPLPWALYRVERG